MFSNLSGIKITHSKSKSDQNNTSKRYRLNQSFQNFLEEQTPEPPSISIADITISI